MRAGTVVPVTPFSMGGDSVEMRSLGMAQITLENFNWDSPAGGAREEVL